MGITELAVLRWLHIIAMVYWLGGEWGVFNTSTHVINRNLSMEERRRRRSSIDRLRLMTWVDVLKTPHSPPSQYTMAMMCSQRNTASSVMPISSAPTD